MKPRSTREQYFPALYIHKQVDSASWLAASLREETCNFRSVLRCFRPLWTAPSSIAPASASNPQSGLVNVAHLLRRGRREFRVTLAVHHRARITKFRRVLELSSSPAPLLRLHIRGSFSRTRMNRARSITSSRRHRGDIFRRRDAIRSWTANSINFAPINLLLAWFRAHAANKRVTFRWCLWLAICFAAPG